MNLVMIVKNRPKLTEQALRSLWDNSFHSWNVTVVDDASGWETQQVLTEFVLRHQKEMKLLRVSPETNVVGRLKNLGVYWSERHFKRGPMLYLSDNDAYFTPHWDKVLCECLVEWENKFKVLGPYRHPYHHPRPQDGKFLCSNRFEVVSTDMVQGIGLLMRWDTWDQWGPFEAHSPGTNQSEDTHFCESLVKGGSLVGSVQPNVVYNCGLTDTNGNPCVGVDVMERYNVLME
jgi:hypothetical protein